MAGLVILLKKAGWRGHGMRRDLRQASFADGLVNQRAGRNGWLDGARQADQLVRGDDITRSDLY